VKTRFAFLAIVIAALLACREFRSPTDPLTSTPTIAGQWRGLLSSLPYGDDSELIDAAFTQNGDHVVATFSTRDLGDLTIEGDIRGRDLSGSVTGVSPAGSYHGSVSGTAADRQIDLEMSALISVDGTYVRQGKSALLFTR
jgi:hypothetical protein